MFCEQNFIISGENGRANNINKQNDNNNWKNIKKKPFQNQLCGVITCMNGNFVIELRIWIWI